MQYKSCSNRKTERLASIKNTRLVIKLWRIKTNFFWLERYVSSVISPMFAKYFKNELYPLPKVTINIDKKLSRASIFCYLFVSFEIFF